MKVNVPVTGRRAGKHRVQLVLVQAWTIGVETQTGWRCLCKCGEQLNTTSRPVFLAYL